MRSSVFLQVIKGFKDLAAEILLASLNSSTLRWLMPAGNLLVMLPAFADNMMIFSYGNRYLSMH